MKIFVLGVGDAFTIENYNTCFVVQGENGFNLAVECPHPYMKILHDVKTKSADVPLISDIDHFIITHLHSDHCSGLETVGFYKKFVESKKTNILMSRKDCLNHLNMVEPSMCGIDISNYGSMFNLYFNYFVLNETTSNCGPFEIKIMNTSHYIPAIALLIKDVGSDKTIGFSSDTCFDMNLIKWLDHADLIFHEVGPAPGHSPIEHLSKLSSNIRSKIRLVHYNDKFNVLRCDYSIEFLEQGQVICL
jgi:ribonuclease BN (tRNA processing enzyme)